MLQDGLSISSVAKYSGLGIEVLEQLRQEIIKDKH